MKKNLIIFGTVITILGLMAFNVFKDNTTSIAKDEAISMYENDSPFITVKEENKAPDFIYHIGPRFSGITKSDVNKAKSIIDFLPSDVTQRVVNYETVSIIIFKDEQLSDIRETGKGGVLNADQLQLLHESDYSTNFVVRADFLEKNPEANILNYSYATPHLTIVPEKQAKYMAGKKELIQYLTNNCKDLIANITPEKFQAATLYFTVTKEGTIKDLRLDRTCGFPEIDNKVVELLKQAPGTWQPAENAKGDKVEQELVVSFGLMGC